jgi:hypothetical protein
MFVFLGFVLRKQRRELAQKIASMPPIRYLLCPDFVTADDGDRHWISAENLMRIYGVPRSECVVATRPAQLRLLLERFIVLEPREDHNYHLPQELRNRR